MNLKPEIHQLDPISPPFPSKRAGFTLIEVIFVVAILALLSGAVASILQGSVASATVLTEIASRQSQVQSFIQLLTTTFRNLSSDTMFMAQKNPAFDQTNLFLMFNNSTQLFNWHRNQSKFPAKLLTWWVNDKGLQTLGIIEYNRYFKLTNSTDSNFSAKGWSSKIALLQDLKLISWRFWNQRTNQWSDDWRYPVQRPEGVELTFQLAESTQPSIHFFYIPPVQVQLSLLTNPPDVNKNSPPPQSSP